MSVPQRAARQSLIDRTSTTDSGLSRRKRQILSVKPDLPLESRLHDIDMPITRNHSSLTSRLDFTRRPIYTSLVCRTCLRRAYSGESGPDPKQSKESFRSRLRTAFAANEIKWKPLPVAFGVVFLGAFQYYRIQKREARNAQEATDEEYDPQGRPKKRKRIRPSGPWYVKPCLIACRGPAVSMHVCG